MIKNAADIREGETLDSEVVIVGAGAAGIPMALEFAEAGFQVLLLESGEPGQNDEIQSLYSGTVTDQALHNPTDTYRQRRLGGTAAIWGGRCVPFDPIDFEKRPYLNYSGWPIKFEQLTPFFEKANDWLEAGAYDYDARTALTPGTPEQIKGLESVRLHTNSLERFSRPTDLYIRYKRRLELHPNLRVLSGANCIGIRLSEQGGQVEHLELSTLAGTKFFAKGINYVLSVGGIETARLLLASNDVNPSGVGNDHDVVGRFYQCHIAGNVGKLTFSGPIDSIHHGYDVSPEGIYCRRRIMLTELEQKRLAVNNVVLRLHFPKIIDPSHKNGVLSSLFILKWFIRYEYAVRLKDGNEQGILHYLKHVMNIVTTPLDTLAFAFNWLRKRSLASRKFPSVILTNKSNLFSLEVHGEQEPNPESRITLTGDKDALGVPKINIDWRYTKNDISSARKTLQVFADELERTGLGKLEIDEGRFEEELMRFGAYGGHHIGTARMGVDPETSVVDENLKVHGVSNLYIASSAVFPTSSQANPTLTLLALGLRLVGHITLKSKDSAVQRRPSASV